MGLGFLSALGGAANGYLEGQELNRKHTREDDEMARQKILRERQDLDYRRSEDARAGTQAEMDNLLQTTPSNAALGALDSINPIRPDSSADAVTGALSKAQFDGTADTSLADRRAQSERYIAQPGGIYKPYETPDPIKQQYAQYDSLMRMAKANNKPDLFYQAFDAKRKLGLDEGEARIYQHISSLGKDAQARLAQTINDVPDGTFKMSQDPTTGMFQVKQGANTASMSSTELAKFIAAQWRLNQGDMSAREAMDAVAKNRVASGEREGKMAIDATQANNTGAYQATHGKALLETAGAAQSRATGAGVSGAAPKEWHDASKEADPLFNVGEPDPMSGKYQRSAALQKFYTTFQGDMRSLGKDPWDTNSALAPQMQALSDQATQMVKADQAKNGKSSTLTEEQARTILVNKAFKNRAAALAARQTGAISLTAPGSAGQAAPAKQTVAAPAVAAQPATVVPTPAPPKPAYTPPANSAAGLVVAQREAARQQASAKEASLQADAQALARQAKDVVAIADRVKRMRFASTIQSSPVFSRMDIQSQVAISKAANGK